MVDDAVILRSLTEQVHKMDLTLYRLLVLLEGEHGNGGLISVINWLKNGFVIFVLISIFLFTMNLLAITLAVLALVQP